MNFHLFRIVTYFTLKLMQTRTFSPKIIVFFLLAGFLVLSPYSIAIQSTSKPSLRFIVYGDCQDGHAIHKKIVAQILKQKPDLVLITGDLVNNAADPSHWKMYDTITEEMRKTFPVYTVRGNHDLNPAYLERFTMPIGSGNKNYYSFDKGNCHFIGLDAYLPLTPDSEQYRWLVQDLEVASRKNRIIFAMLHPPIYGIGWHGSDLRIRKVLAPLFTKYGVRAVFNGHDHNYYRTLREGVTYITSGGGGGIPYPPNPKKGAIAGDKWALAFHYVLYEVFEDKVKAVAIRWDGKSFDTFMLMPKSADNP